MPKKPPYIGNPNATLTICYEKCRRHLPSDLLVYTVPPLESQVDKSGEKLSEEAIKKAGLDKPTYIVRCRHCKEDPYIRKTDTIQ